MKKTFSRRDVLKTGLASGAGMLIFDAGGLGKTWAAEAKEKICMTMCNHWSYTGIGWQLGIESNVLSVTDAMRIVDQPPYLKTCINLDARAFEIMAEKFPDVIDRLKRYLAEGKLEVIGGTYGQPMGTTVGGESNIRQFVLGCETIRKVLNYEMVTFLEEEEFTHPQVPQLAAGTDYRYTSLAQLDTWGRTGVPAMEHNVIRWKGVDGTAMPCFPKNPAIFPAFWYDTKEVLESAGFQKLKTLGTPLVMGWVEFGWEDPEHPAYATAERSAFLEKYKYLADRYSVECVTLKEYLDKHGDDAKESVYLAMDAFDKVLTWGVGGDQLRILDRKVEKLLLTAELFDAVAACQGAKSQAESLENAWKDLLASQSHDVGLCEYSRWQEGQMPPLDRLEDKHNFPWGALGYVLLDSAQKQGQQALDAALKTLTSRINSQDNKQGKLAATVFNSHDEDRTGAVMTGRLYPLPEKAQGIVVKDRAGRALPSQIVKSEQDRQGNFITAEIAFLASKTPSAGYDTYYLEPISSSQPAAKTDLLIDPSKFVLENEHLRVTLDPLTGAIASLIHKSSGRESIEGKQGAFPRFMGKPNPNLSLRPQPPATYGSSTSKAQLDWTAKGPLFATVRAKHRWKYLNFETRVTLTAGQPYVEVVSRVFAQVPPLFAGGGFGQPPLTDTNFGYWLSFMPAFEVSKVMRDYPLAAEATEKKAFHALTFADLLGKDFGLLVLHPGTQWFARDEKGTVANLIMREWESYFTHEYGCPLYSEYRHALIPHGLAEMNNAARLRAAADFSQPLLCRIGEPHAGDLPSSKSFLRVTPETVMLSAFHKKTSAGLELRVVETEGQTAKANVEIGMPVKEAVETNLRGRKIGEVSRRENKLSFPINPWKIRTFEVT